ncbi:MAG: hypothetical protein ACRDQW_02075 [Haloechinothrix sp.]
MRASRLDVFLLLDGQGLPSDNPTHSRQREEHDNAHHQPQAGAEHRGQRHAEELASVYPKLALFTWWVVATGAGTCTDRSNDTDGPRSLGRL